MTKEGKNQSFPRECNVDLVINCLKESPRSGTEIADILSLSNATVSSIIKDLTERGIIEILNFTSISGLGRKRIVYQINKMHALVLSINISNLHAIISISNLHEEIMNSIDIQVEKYDASTIYQLILEATKLLMNYSPKESPLGYIVISLPGMVNAKTGELVLSKQFDKELFSEKHFIQNVFRKQFPDTPVLLINDINLMTLGEMHQGEFDGVNNAVYISVDYGVGGGLVINSQIFEGDLGYAGEFGLMKYYNGVKEEPIDEAISIRALVDQSSRILGHQISKDELFNEYQTNKIIHDLVIESAQILGKTIKELYEVLNISHFVLAGKIINFGDDYLNAVKEELDNAIQPPEVVFSKLSSRAEIIGAAYLGAEYILKGVSKK